MNVFYFLKDFLYRLFSHHDQQIPPVQTQQQSPITLVQNDIIDPPKIEPSKPAVFDPQVLSRDEKTQLLSTEINIFISSLCIWNGYIVMNSGSNSFSIWIPHGKYLFSIENVAQVISIVSYHDYLVTSHADRTVQFWKMKPIGKDRLPQTDDIERIRTISREISTALFSVYEGRVFAGNSTEAIEVCNIIDHSENFVEVGRTMGGQTLLKVMLEKDYVLYGGCLDGSILKWKMLPGPKLEGADLMKHNSVPLTCMCFWGDDTIASGHINFKVGVWNLADGTVKSLFSVASCPTALVEWQGRLVCGTTDNIQPEIYVWNPDGNLHLKIQCAMSSSCLLAYGTKLWQGGLGKVGIYSERMDWTLERVLWIGWKKNTYPECSIAGLPREILLVIINLI